MALIFLLGCKTESVPASRIPKNPAPGAQKQPKPLFKQSKDGIEIPGMNSVRPSVDTSPFSPEEECIQADLGPPRWKTIRSGGVDIRLAHGAFFGLRGREQRNEYDRINEFQCEQLGRPPLSPLANLGIPAPECNERPIAPIHAARKGSRFFLHFGDAYFKNVKVEADGRGIHLLLSGMDSCSLAEQKVLSEIEGDCNVKTFLVLESRTMSRVSGQSVDGKMEFDILLRGDTVVPATELGKWPCASDFSP